MLSLAAELGIVAIGISFLMISCEFDLSVGSIFGFSVYIMIDLANHGISPLFALLLVQLMVTL